VFSAVFENGRNRQDLFRVVWQNGDQINRRFAYEEVQEIIDQGKGEYASEIEILNKVALKLREERFRKGSFNFETQEVRFKLE